MNRLCLLVLSCAFLIPRWGVADGNVVPSLQEAPFTRDSAHLLTAAQTARPWTWHTRLTGRWFTPAGAARRASQFRLNGAIGMGLPGRLEVNLGLPMGATVGHTEGLGLAGGGLGDLRASVLWAAKSESQGGLSVLLGASLRMPTGGNETLLGEGALSFSPFVAVTLNAFGAELMLNLGYLWRPEHVGWKEGDRVEQDDDVTWGVAVRAAKAEGVRFSIEAQGAIGVQTDEGPWPGVEGRPVWLGGGMDYPVERRWLGLMCGVLLGGTGPGFLLGVRFTAIPTSRDEDRDGIRGRRDKCPLMKEDLDGFEDGDGCPDLDNDGDGFPDKEDACPGIKADSFSDDGCATAQATP